MKNILLILALLPLAAQPVAAATATLQPSPAGPSADFQPATLAIHNDLGQVIRAVTLHWPGGGPTMFFAVAIPPGTTQDLTVQLPAIDEDQAYDVALLADPQPDAVPLQKLAARITWPPAQANPELFQSLRYRTLRVDQPQWPPAQLRILWIVAMAGAIAMGALILIRRPRLRLAMLLVTIAAATMAAWALTRDYPLVAARTMAMPQTTGAPSRNIVVLASRRTVQWSADRVLIPIYLTPQQMRSDDSVIAPGKWTRVTLTPREVRLFIGPQ